MVANQQIEISDVLNVQNQLNASMIITTNNNKEIYDAFIVNASWNTDVTNLNSSIATKHKNYYKIARLQAFQS